MLLSSDLNILRSLHLYELLGQDIIKFHLLISFCPSNLTIPSSKEIFENKKLG